MTYQTPTQTMEWIKENIHDPIPQNDKSRLSEWMDVLTHEDDHSLPEKEAALKALGLMSLRYGAFFVITCGIVPLIKHYLLSDNRQLSLQAARSVKYIAQSGGCDELIQDGIDEDLKSIVRNIHKDFDIRDMCSQALGWIVAYPPAEIKSDIIQ